ncbi:hypothetical protein BH10BAC1_BH10BAC1_10850 [soil metagenome]
MKKVTLIILVLIASFSLQAQTYVTIPDAKFVGRLAAIVPSAMLGNQMDITDPAVIALTSINLYNDTISDLDGIQYFTSLQILDCSFNNLDSLHGLPNSLISLNCTFNNIQWLPNLPSTLISLTCNQNQLDSLPSLPSTLTTLYCENNQLTSLPILPSTLTELHCSGNLLTLLPALPSSITLIACAQNELDSLPTLPISLTDLNCSNNTITALPTLPNSLLNLLCGGNLITSLPALSTSLQSLECYNNQLTTLPTLPATLISIICGNNLITVLPALPSALATLVCYNNQLPVLPTLPFLLTYLNCSTNLLPVLPTLPGALNYLNCSNNPLPTLPTLPGSLFTLYCANNTSPALPTLPPSLNLLNCSYNLFTTLPTLPTTLTILICDNNPLDSLPTLPNSLDSLDCNFCTLDSLPALANLTRLDCTDNYLTYLPTLPIVLTRLNCNSNQLTDLPSLPNGLLRLYSYNNMINCFPIFPNTIVDLNISANPYTCLPNFIPAMDSIMLETPLCITGDFVNNPYNCAGSVGILGFTYIDNNADCLKDSLDFRLKNIPVKLYDSLGTLLSQTYTAINGIYDFPKPAGTYTVIVDTTGLPFAPQCANPGIDSTVSTYINPLTTDVNFNFNCKPGFDIGVQSVIRYGFAFPGEQQSIRIKAGDMSQIYNLSCASGVSGQVTITVLGPMTYNGPMAGALTPTVIGNTYTYSISDFATINNNTAFGLSFITDTNAAAGATICVYTDVTPVGGDNDTANNSYDFCYKVVNSHDPNIKETYPELVPMNYSDYFTYTIHFQNTGTAPAINIHIEDTLDSNLDLTTFEFLDASHLNTVSLNANILTVRFPNIMLVDSTVSADSSQGYIQYRIKPKTGLPITTKIYNTASIYFDFNAAVVTNTTINMFRPYTTNINAREFSEGLSIYPNPASDFVNIKVSSESKNIDVKIYDATGRLVKNIPNAKSGESTIDISDLENGLYLINLDDGNSTNTKRFVKQ